MPFLIALNAAHETLMGTGGIDMVNGQTLLERLEHLSGSASDTLFVSGDELELTLDSIRSNLRRLLTARHGMCQTVPDYGIPAFSDIVVGGKDYAAVVRAAIQFVIEKYEPRLLQPRVTLVADEVAATPPRSLTFRIDAVVRVGAQRHRVFYDSRLIEDGRFSIEG